MSGIAQRAVSGSRQSDLPQPSNSGAGDRRGLVGRRDAMLEVDTVARRHAEKVGRTPDHIVLELGDLAVGIDQLPHHLYDAKPALLIDRAHDDAGEMIEIDRLA